MQDGLAIAIKDLKAKDYLYVFEQLLGVGLDLFLVKQPLDLLLG